MTYGKLRLYAALVVAWARGGKGQALAEFTLVLALVALAALAALTAVGLAVSGFYESFADLIT